MRRDARVKAFTLIFEKLFGTSDEFDGEIIDQLKKAEDRDFARAIANSFESNAQELQQTVSKYLTGYEISRVYKVDLALIYTALCEIKFVHTPKQVALNEMIEIAKEYSTEKSPQFIHGVMSAIIKGEKL